MSYNYCTVQGKYQSSTGVPAVGRVEWWTTSPVVDSTNHVTLAEVVDELMLDATGMFSVSLLATDNAGLSVFGWAFRPSILGVSNEIQLMQVLHATLPNPAWLDQLTTYIPP